MKCFENGTCPACDSQLMIGKLVCPVCFAEYPIEQPLSKYDVLSPAKKDFLEIFLRCEGNYKDVEETLHISYPALKKRLEDLLIALQLKEETSKRKEEFDMKLFGKIDRESKKASEIIRAKLFDEKGEAKIPLLNGDICTIWGASGSFSSDKLGAQTLDYSVFDIIVDFLKENDGKAPKGLGRQDKVGIGKCSDNTVMYAVATKYYGKKYGDSTFDPIFVLAAVLDWADIAYNERGYIRLK